MSSIAYYNGEFGQAADMKVSLLDRALYFGDGCYEAAFVVGTRAIDLDFHLDRFYNSLRLMKIDYKKSREETKTILKDCLDRCSDNEYSILYWQCSRGTAPRSHAFPAECTPNLMVTVDEKKFPDYKTPAPMITREDTRFFHCNIKTLNLFPNVMANQEAHAAGAFEAILIRPDGKVTEGSHTNAHILKDGKLICHEDGNLILPGITKKRLFIIAEQLGVTVEQRAFTREELFDADEVFVTSSTAFLKRASSLDGKPCRMAAGELFEKLANAYAAFVLEK